jgi:signal recognition particle subunit SRP54
MFDSLTSKLGEILDSLTKRGALSENDVDSALREIRIALIEADVALNVVKSFIESVKQRAIGEEVLRSVTPGQMVIKIVHDHLVEMLGGANEDASPNHEDAGLNLVGVPPVVVLMVGLQGSGKTTTSAKLGLRIKKRDKKKVLMASLDVYRPAAQQQLEVLGSQSDVPTLPVIMGEKPVGIASRAMDMARREGYDVVILDTAGRMHVDQELMDEVAKISAVTNPIETLLVADAMTGQDAVNMAKEFDEKVGVTGIVLTRVDGDARGGAALSMRAVTGKPIKLMGVGERLDELESFQASRIAGRILGQGDIVGLVEKAAEVIDKEDAEKLAKKMMKGQFTLNDMAEQLKQVRSMGDVGGLLGMVPGLSKMKKQISEANIDDKMIARQQAILSSMTPSERYKPKVLNGSRRRRIAAGSGTSVQDVNRLLKQHKQMGQMMKKMGKMGPRGMMSGGMPPGMMPRG